ncbi:UDP-N-acetylmuramoyl-L-alanyl-D-glutamate--2,6-diaminopimelate ligase [Saccharospirillum sp. MSK14-1]|uniref:UDP-N-acetylmuramoyl-L-alanyl-D-glutamate--2, 6-diaminopimelate ligase n=1 Tax=Saccharospirillum sp. MSK14-1 TaxID=1897632 RepID=UPI000D3BC209|nr:UDP-N-acetylmuramoyl-L-alanyl-D-glutamate--2,6-diaminopimelate ligase [Saccharospirillum sp. MSK14-1]PTY38980.1 UDP-N-acetylmuramoyl-L-alanyl-D-glutamate--2,6-diaminopimelate ligase [Saccharospirillum sp. MSK14-1]
MKVLSTWLPEHSELTGIKALDLTLDSREVRRGSVFVALAGASFDGHDYIDEAIQAGAVAVLAERSIGERDVPIIVLPQLRSELGELAHRFFDAPSEQLGVIGITGTNGKTSTCQYIAQSLDFLGRRCGIIGTNGQGLWGALQQTQNTTPDVIRLHKELSRQWVQGGRYSAMEVSSHGLDQGRVDSVRYRTAVFTNLSRDHLDYHGTMENYGNAKWRLFQWPGLVNAVVNLDDDWVRTHKDNIRAQRVLTYGEDAQADVRVLASRCHPTGLDARVATPWGETELNLPLLGRFNLSNALAAFAVLLCEDVPLSTAARVLSNLRPVSGRMEKLLIEGGPTVVVDYAHTPDALEKALSACRDHVEGRLGVVFGCGGDRDKGKRPEMAAVAEASADFVVITDDNPRSESSASILADIRAGFSAPEAVTVIADRHDAIVDTLGRSGENDVILIAGKGHEAYQEISGVRHDFSDQQTVRDWLEAQHVD